MRCLSLFVLLLLIALFGVLMDTIVLSLSSQLRRAKRNRYISFATAVFIRSNGWRTGLGGPVAI